MANSSNSRLAVKRILIIDDEPKFYESLFQNKDKNWERVYAVNEQDAQDKISEYNGQIDIIILDLSLEGKDSYEKGLNFLDTLFTLIPADVPVFIVTSDDDMKTYQAALDSGAAGFLHKGNYSAGECMAEIEEILNCYTKRIIPRIDKASTCSSPLKEMHKTMLSIQSNPSDKAAILICGPEEVGKMHWAVSIGTRNTPEIAYQIIDLSKFTRGDWGFPNWYFPSNLNAVIESRGIDPDLIIFSRVETVPLENQDQIAALIQQGKNIILLSRDYLGGAVEAGTFSKELYDLLLPFPLPSLTQRPEDIEYFANQFLLDPEVCPAHKPSFGKHIREVLTEDEWNILVSHSWTTNFRELRSTIQYVTGHIDRTKGLYRGIRNFPPTFSAGSTRNPIPNAITQSENWAAYRAGKIEQKLLGGNIDESEKEELIALNRKHPTLFEPRYTSRGIDEFTPELASIPDGKIEILVCFSNKNEQMARDFKKHLDALTRCCGYSVESSFWHDPLLSGVGERDDKDDKKLSEALKTAHFLVVILCPDIRSSRQFGGFIYPRFADMQSHRLFINGRSVFPGEYELIDMTTPLPKGVPLEKLSPAEQNVAFVEIVHEIQKALCAAINNGKLEI